MGDGDTIFALATGALERSASLTLLGALGAEVTAVAVQRAVRAARGLQLPGGLQLPAACDLEQQGDTTP
jgi:L-aminopeptidase/D-esterase-like protein